MFASLLTLALAAAPVAPLTVHRAPFPKAATVRAARADSVQSLALGFVLKDRSGLDALIAAQHDPKSPSFRQWLTPWQFGERFGAPDSVYESAARTLEAAGLRVERSPNRLYLSAEGTVAQVQRALGVSMVDVTAGEEVFRSWQGTPKFPAELAPWIQSVHRLDNRIRVRHRLDVKGTDTFGPQDLRRYYDMDALHAAGYSGQLSKVGVIGTVPSATNAVNPDDINWFYRNVSDSTAQFVLDSMPLGSGQADSEPGLKVELEMDAEMSTVAAPLEQSVTMVLAPPEDLFPAGVNEVDNKFYDLTAVSTSFGSCEVEEEGFSPGTLTTVSNLVAQGSVEGIAFFTASGDDGVLTCIQLQDPATENVPSVDFPSAIPYVVAVGGTMYTGTFDATSAISGYGQETTWNEEGNQVAGGGGISNHYAKPSWQTVPGTSDAGFREVPDISLLADITPGVAITSTRPGQIDPIGNGTSDAAPMAAGIFAAVNDRIGGCRLGTPNFELYALGQAQYGAGGTAVFHDITTGNVSVLGTDGGLVQGAAAHTGYDEATGLGSVDVNALANAWQSCAVAPADFDGGPAIDAGLPGFDGGAVDVEPWDGGFGLDAGARPAYDACGALACDGGSLCITTTQGPSACVTPCSPSAANSCGLGSFCDPQDAGSGFCEIGCGVDADCAGQGDGGEVCYQCAHACLEPGNDQANVGSACGRRSGLVCPTGAECLGGFEGFPGGYCTFECDNGCGCPSDSACISGFCFESCSVSAQSGCEGRSDAGYVCDPIDATDTGVCLPDCNQEGCFGSGLICNANGVCTPPGGTNAGTTATASSSSGGSSGSTATSTSSTSGTSAAGSSSGGSSAGSTTGRHSGGSAQAASSGSTGSNPNDKIGCGCSLGGGNGSMSGVFGLAIALWAARRRRVR